MSGMANATGKSYVITGGTGFIGTALKKALAARGDWAWTVDIAGKPDMLIDVNLPNPDIRLAMAIQDGDGVFHLAGNADSRWCEEEPYEALGMLRGAMAVGDLCLRYNKPLVFASTGFVYGLPEKKTGIITSHSMRPTGVYGLTKLQCEQTLRLYESRGLRLRILRLFNVYGAGQEQANSYKSTLFLDKFQEIMDAPKDGQVRVSCPPWVSRDFVDIVDVVSAFIRGMVSFTSNMPLTKTVFNVGCGYPVIIGEALRMLAVLAGRKDVAFVYNEKAHPDDPGGKLGMPYFAGENLLQGYVSLDQGLKKMVEHLLVLRETAAA